jgi:hypothetical protein
VEWELQQQEDQKKERGKGGRVGTDAACCARITMKSLGHERVPLAGAAAAISSSSSRSRRTVLCHHQQLLGIVLPQTSKPGNLADHALVKLH